MTPTPFRVTPEDIDDSKIGQAISPLMDSLNLTLNDICNILTGRVGADNLTDEVKVVKVAVDVLASPLVTFATKVVKPTCVVLANIVPADAAHSLATPFVLQGWSLTDSGQIQIGTVTGVLASNSYQFTFWVRA
jgi:hypothetical protein